MVDICGTGLDTAEDTDSELEGRRREAPGVGSDHVPFRRPNQTWGRDEKVQQRDWCPQSTDQSPERKSSEQVTDAASDEKTGSCREKARRGLRAPPGKCKTPAAGGPSCSSEKRKSASSARRAPARRGSHEGHVA